ncbi:TPA: hypothetical protein OMU21_004959 [Klebsiella aerogenes]|nr:hypothetical protein [Klebsiella aerogenes]
MARTNVLNRASRTPGVFRSGGGYKGVSRCGSSYGWKWVSNNGQHFQKGGYETPEEAAYAYDEFVTASTEGRGETNQMLGYLKEKTILKIREKVTKAEKHIPKCHKSSKVGKTGFKGVYETKSKKKPYTSQIAHDGKLISLGSFVTAEDAARAYDAAVLKYKGLTADTNLSRGLLPPLSEHKFDPNKKRQDLSLSDNNQRNNILSSNNTANVISLDPYDVERQRQIEAARMMAADEEEDDQPTPRSSVSLTQAAPPPAQAEKPQASAAATAAAAASISPAPVPQDITAPEPELLVAEDPFAGVIATMRRALAEDEARRMGAMRLLLDRISAEVEGYQKAAMELIDRGAAIETAISSLRNMLNPEK